MLSFFAEFSGEKAENPKDNRKKEQIAERALRQSDRDAECAESQKEQEDGHAHLLREGAGGRRPLTAFEGALRRADLFRRRDPRTEEGEELRLFGFQRGVFFGALCLRRGAQFRRVARVCERGVDTVEFFARRRQGIRLFFEIGDLDRECGDLPLRSVDVAPAAPLGEAATLGVDALERARQSLGQSDALRRRGETLRDRFVLPAQFPFGEVEHPLERFGIQPEDRLADRIGIARRPFSRRRVREQEAVVRCLFPEGALHGKTPRRT